MSVLRVASVPSGHPYVRHLAPVTGVSSVLRLPDPAVAGAPAGQWWPSPVLEPQWLRAHCGDYDLVHVHFGFEHRSTAQLVELVATLRALGRPLVLTVHDLDNPHLTDQAPHLAALGVLVPAAAAVVTLTAGAAAEVERRWGRAPVVLAHPHVVALDRLGRARPPHEGFVVGLHDKRRAGSAPDEVRSELVRAVDALPASRVAAAPAGRLDDDALWDHLSTLDVLVLAYRSGTHSGFVEACHDLGTTVVAPDRGFWAQQQPVLTYDLGVPGSLTAALRRAHAERPHHQADPAARTAQREALAAAHAELYARAIAQAAA